MNQACGVEAGVGFGQEGKGTGSRAGRGGKLMKAVQKPSSSGAKVTRN